MTQPINRRRFLTIAACGVAVGGPVQAGTVAWRGSALGAQATIRLGGTGRARAAQTFAAVAAELSRLEDIFSLHRPDSALSMLNRQGRLDAPPADLLTALILCDTLHRATLGAFDPTIQPLWLALAAGRPTAPAQRLVGWDRVNLTTARIAFQTPGMALTLNGIAQGYITDRIADLLRASGYRDVLVDMGEIAALGQNNGQPWRADIAAPDGIVSRRITLRDRCLATSAPRSMLLNRMTRTGHIFDPRPGPALPPHRLVAVSANGAAIADGLSTGCCLLTARDAATAVARVDGAQLETLI